LREKESANALFQIATKIPRRHPLHVVLANLPAHKTAAVCQYVDDPDW